MEGKNFLCCDNTPPLISQLGQDDFVFDLQRFATQALTGYFDATEAAGYDSSTEGKFFKVTSDGTNNARYFNDIKAALNYIYTNDSNVYYQNETYTATIELLQDVGTGSTDAVNAGDAFMLGGTMSVSGNKLAISTPQKSNITIDLGGHTYSFFTSLTNKNSTANKEKAITTKIGGGDFTIKNGSFGIAPTSVATFERLIKNYVNLTLEDVTIDGSNFADMAKEFDGSIINQSAGTLKLTGTTSITAPTGGYAVAGKYGPKDWGDFNIEINTSGTISNVAMYEYNEAKNNAKLTDFSKATLKITGGTIGEVAYSEKAVELGAVNYTTISSGAVVNGITYGTQDQLAYAESTVSTVYDTRQKSSSALYDFGQAGWNVSTSDSNKYNFVAASLTSDGTDNTLKAGQIVIGAEGGDTNSYAYDATNYVIGLPTLATATWGEGVGNALKAKYGVTKMNYNSKKDAVTLSEASVGSDDAYIKLVAKNNATSAGLFAETVQKIDASAVNIAASIVGNSLSNELYGGAGNDSLTGTNGNNVFYYSKGKDVITDYTISDSRMDKVVVTNSDFTPDVTKITADSDFVIAIDANNELKFSGKSYGTSVLPTGGIRVKNNNDGKEYVYTNYAIADVTKDIANGVTLNSAVGSSFEAKNSFVTIDGAAVSSSLNITGFSNNNSIIAAAGGGSLNGNGGDDTLVGGAGNDVFVYASGKGVINDYGKSGEDKLSITDTIITGAKVNAKDQLIFSTNNKDNTLTFNAVNDKAVAAVSLESSGFLTKDGKFANNTLKLFADTKGRVDTTDSIYAGIAGIDASAVTGNVVTMTGGTAGGTFTFASNKKADVFEYNGGTVSLVSYVADSDKIDLGDYTFTSFKSDSTGVSLNASTSGGGTGTIVIDGDHTSKEILLHDDIRDKRNQYSKLVFAADNVLQDKASKPTSATVFGGATEYRAGNTVKNITVDDRTTGASIYAGDINTNIDASAAGVGVSLFSGAKNDKFTGSKGNDLFVYSAGKDVINGYASGDSISLGDFSVADITKISKSGKSITFKFDKNSNSLNVKSTSAIGTININGEDYTFGKKSTIIKGGVASLTSGFSGTYTADSSATSIIGSEVTKNLTIKGQKNIADYIVAGNGKKTKLQGQGGNDSLIGGSGSDTFFYKKGESGNISIKNFGAGDDNIKINGSKVIAENGLSTDINKSLTITMANNASITIDDFAPATGSTAETKTIKDILIKANNTAYWFDETYTPEGSSTAGGWVTSVDKISKSAMKNSGLAIVDLGYATNLVKAGLAYKDENVTLPSASSGGSENTTPTVG